MKPFQLIRKYFRRTILILNIVLSSLLLLSYLSVYISPLKFSGLAFLGYIYSILLLLNLFFLIFWIFLKSGYFAISCLSILLGWNSIITFIQFNVGEESLSNARNINVLSYNVRVFDLWNWSSDKDRASQIYKYIKQSKAEIVCLQEFYSSKIKGKNARDSLLNSSVLKYAHISYTKKKSKTYNHGIATFSAFQIVTEGSIKINENDNFCIYSELKIDDDTVRVYNIHLESIHLGYDDYQLIENINKQDTINVGRIKKIIIKLKRGFEKRARQSELIADHIEKCHYPIILCGDFNDPPISYVYHNLRKKLKDSFCESATGIGSTYINRFSTFRIDFIMHSSSFNSISFDTPHIELSDHYPVESTLQMIE